ncbi:MAG: hypothetical protein ACFFD3_05585 [Candidatus Thorarchaeota archaeon]
MKIFNRLLDLFGARRRTLLGAVDQPDNLMTYLYAVRARAFLKLTGKALSPKDSLLLKDTGKELSDSTRDLSPSRRLLRREL